VIEKKEEGVCMGLVPKREVGVEEKVGFNAEVTEDTEKREWKVETRKT